MQPLKAKILTVWQEDSLAETPQIAAKKRCVPALFQNALLERDSFRGIVVSGLRAWLPIDDEEGRWQQIFQTVFAHIETSDVGQFTGRRGYLLYKYIAQPPCPLNCETLFTPTKARTPATKEFIEKFSLLKSGGKEADILGAPESLPLESLLPLAEGVFGEEVNEAVATRHKLKKIVAEKDKEGLKKCAQEMAASIQRMEAGETKLHFATLPTQTTHIVLQKNLPDPLLNDLQEFLLENKEAEAVTEQLKARASPALQKVLQAQGLMVEIKRVLNQSLIAGKPLWQQILLYPADCMRSQTNDMAKQMAAHLNQELDERFAAVLTPPLQKELHHLLMTDEGIPAALESRLKLFSEKKLGLLKQETHTVLSTIAEKLPAVVPALAELSGQGRLGRLEQPFWLEWKKGENGLYTLSVYITGQSIVNRPLVDGEPQSVLHFKQISKEQMDEAFFLRLLSYESDPVWKNGTVSYSFADVEEGLLSALNQAPASKSQKAHQSYGNWGILMEYAGENGVDAERNYFMAKREALIALWHKPNREANKRALEENALQLAKEGLKLYDRGAIDELQLNRTYATCYEVLASIAPVQWKKAHIFPQGLIDVVRKLLSATGCSTANLMLIKEVLSDALGVEAEEDLDALLRMVQEDLGVINPRPSLIKLPWQIDRALQVWKVARFAVGYYLSPKIFVVQVVTFVAYRVFSAYFPSTLLLIQRWKRKIVVKTASMLIPKRHLEMINQVLLSYRLKLASDRELTLTYKNQTTGEQKAISLAGLQKLGPDHPAEARLAKLNLPFQVNNELKIESSAIPGFFVAPIQKHEALIPYGSYLLLQNSLGEKKVLLPLEGIEGAFVNGLFKRFGLGEAAVFDTVTPKNDGKYFEYSMDKEGRLISSDANAATYLLLYHLAKWNLREVNFYLQSLGEIGKKNELPEILPKVALALHLLALITHDQPLMMNALRLTILLQGKRGLELPQLNMLSLFFTQANFSKYLENRKFIYPPLTTAEELTILHAIKEEGKNFCQGLPIPNKLLNGYIDGQDARAAFNVMMETFVLFPEIDHRYNELASSQSAATQAGKTALKNIGTSLAEPLATAIESYQFRLAAVNIPLKEKLIPLEELPTSFSEADPDFICQNFLSYYVLAQQNPPRDREKRKLFLAKVEEFKRTLTYLQGNYIDKTSDASVKLLHMLLTTPTLTLLPPPEQLRSVGLAGLIAQCENSRLALKTAGGALTVANNALEEYGWQLECILNGQPLIPLSYWAANLGWSAWQKAKEILQEKEETPYVPALLPMFDLIARLKIGEPLKKVDTTSLNSLHSQLEQAAADLSRFLAQEKEALVKQLENNLYTAQPGIDEVKKSMVRLFDAPMDFDTLFELYLKKDLQQLKQRADCTDAMIDQLNEKLYRYQVLLNHQQQIQHWLQRVIDLQEIPQDNPAFEEARARLAREINEY